MKKLIKCIIFCAIAIALVFRVSDILVPKAANRYYILEKYLDENDAAYDVQVFGSCHSYTSFNPVYLEEQTGVTGFVYGNAGEIIPTTYVRMKEQFEEYVPKVALVEIWGINPYETYSAHERVFGFYFQNNLERLPLSSEKLEVIGDFDTLDIFEMNFPIALYKDRITDGELTNVDFNYSFEGIKPYSTEYNFNEMSSRLANNGFKVTPSKSIEDYPDYQNYIGEDEFLEIEPDIVKYIEKIIALCEEYGVTLIFYRSPYLSTANELRKLNHLEQICAVHGILFVDLEAEVDYDYTVDFEDYQHLSETGANKSTLHLAEYILDAIK